jgi:hypothetical protein
MSRASDGITKEDAMNWNKKGRLLLAGSLLMSSAQAPATTMLQMDLGQLTARAGTIFRGTVIDVEQGTVAAGGGQIPAVTYRLAVEEIYKGKATSVKGDKAVVVLRMVGSIKAPMDTGGQVRLDTFRDVPKLEMGSDYLLFTTPQSQVGLSVTVGLGQGAFRIVEMERQDYVVNEFNNVGLGLDGSGPVPYSELSAKIRALLGQ